MPYKTQHSIRGKGQGYSCPRVLHAEDKTDSWMHHSTAPGNSEVLRTKTPNTTFYILAPFLTDMFCRNKSYEEN